jgi:hypothetical protein
VIRTLARGIGQIYLFDVRIDAFLGLGIGRRAYLGVDFVRIDVVHRLMEVAAHIGGGHGRAADLPVEQ